MDKNYEKLQKDCVRVLKHLSELEEDTFKSRAYSYASITVGNISVTDFKYYCDVEDFRELSGVGNGINNKLLEVIETGTCKRLEELANNKVVIKERKSFSTTKIPYQHALNIFNSIVGTYNLQNMLTLCGSMRRESVLIGDIDVLVDEAFYSLVVTILSNHFEVLSSGDEKTSLLIDTENNIQMDIICTSTDDFAAKLLYLTGSKEFNISMRRAYAEKGYKLNQHGAYVNGKLIQYEKEEDYFNLINWKYIEPKYR